MRLLEAARDKIVGALAGFSVGLGSMRATAVMAEVGADTLKESQVDRLVREGVAELELMIEDMSWKELTAGQSAIQFSRRALHQASALANLMYIVNPLIRRSVTVQELYVWGSGCEIKSDDKDVNEVLNDFFNNPKNQQVIGPVLWPEREREQRINGNTFFAFFVNPANGAVRVRLIPLGEVDDIICNPQDSKEVWFYKRVMPSEDGKGPSQTVLYPDINYTARSVPGDVANYAIKWDTKVLHLKTGSLSDMKFGMPELFSSMPYARSYKGILENFATVLNAYARVAMQITGQKGKKDVAASKSKLGTGVNAAGGQVLDNNPAMNTASWFLSSGGVQLSAVKTAHSTTGPDEARAFRSMVAAGADTPEHFYGDSDIGNFATSETLDRPTELKMISRQALWAGVIQIMSAHVILQSAKASNGKLRQAGFVYRSEPDPFDRSQVEIVVPPKSRTTVVKVEFPNIIDRDVVERVRSVVQVATLNGNKAEGIIPDRKLLFTLLMKALGIKNAEELANQQYPTEVKQGFADPKVQQEIDMKKATMKNNPVQAQNS